MAYGPTIGVLKARPTPTGKSFRRLKSALSVTVNHKHKRHCNSETLYLVNTAHNAVPESPPSRLWFQIKLIIKSGSPRGSVPLEPR